MLAWYVALPTTLAIINPKLGKFNVTAKGGLVERSYFDWTTSLPYTILMVLNIARLWRGPGAPVLVEHRRDFHGGDELDLDRLQPVHAGGRRWRGR